MIQHNILKNNKNSENNKTNKNTLSACHRRDALSCVANQRGKKVHGGEFSPPQVSSSISSLPINVYHFIALFVINVCTVCTLFHLAAAFDLGTH